MMSKLLVLAALLVSGPSASAQEWEEVKANGAYVWGEGWGASVEEADQAALSALISKISVAVTSDFRQVEEQVESSRGNEYYRSLSNRSSAYSSLTLANTHRAVLKTGRRAHVGRWISRAELDRLFAGREERILEYEESAIRAEQTARVDEALRYHYWAYVLLRSLQRPSELRDEGGRMLLNLIPERLNAVLEDLRVSMSSHIGDAVRLNFTFRGRPVAGLDFSYFDGARWVPGTPVRAGSSLLEMAPGALAETIQLRIEYAYKGDSLMDTELYDTMNVRELKPLKKAFVSFRAKSN